MLQYEADETYMPALYVDTAPVQLNPLIVTLSELILKTWRLFADRTSVLAVPFSEIMVIALLTTTFSV